MENKLKPCPFCGGEAVIRNTLGKYYISPNHTSKCFIEPNTWLQCESPLKKQIKAWNTRAEVQSYEED